MDMKKRNFCSSEDIRKDDYSKAIKLFNEKKYKEAKKLFEKILKSGQYKSKNGFIYFYFGEIYRIEGQSEKAKEAYLKFKRILFEKEQFGLNDIQFRYYIGKINSTSHIYANESILEDGTIIDIKRAIAIDKQLSILYQKQSDIEKAIKNFEEYMNNNKEYKSIVHIYLGKLYMLKKEYYEAENHFHDFINKNNDDPVKSMYGNIELGRLYHIRGDKKLTNMRYSKTPQYERYTQRTDEQAMLVIDKCTYENRANNVNGIFIFKPTIEALKKLIKINREKKQIGYMCEMYDIKYPNCGYRVDENDEITLLSNLRIVTTIFSDTIITAFPFEEKTNNQDYDLDNKEEKTNTFKL